MSEEFRFNMTIKGRDGRVKVEAERESAERFESTIEARTALTNDVIRAYEVLKEDRGAPNKQE